MALCPNGHENPDGHRFCNECGAQIGGPAPTLATGPSGSIANDGFFWGLALVGLAALVMFIVAMVSAGNINTRDQFDTYSYLAGLGAAPWAVVTL
ncbi:MAG TPA: zinc ribbon domain-containing protein, partial [Acidimicrobiia bacterium]|nr:zinc ribbon domain-containing protein [Acidimicrobiia bacterium]